MTLHSTHRITLSLLAAGVAVAPSMCCRFSSGWCWSSSSISFLTSSKTSLCRPISTTSYLSFAKVNARAPPNPQRLRSLCLFLLLVSSSAVTFVFVFVFALAVSDDDSCSAFGHGLATNSSSSCCWTLPCLEPAPTTTTTGLLPPYRPGDSATLLLIGQPAVRVRLA